MADFSDIGKVEAIERLYEGTAFKAWDKTSFETDGRAQVCAASRLFLEGVDFDLVYYPLKHLGYKCVTAVTGEIYAAFSHPRSLSARLGVSAKLDFSQVKELWEGMTVAAREHGYSHVDLDLSPSRNGLTVSVSATGEASKATISLRPKLKSMDLICVCGSLGAAFLGLTLLEKGRKSFDNEGIQPDLEKNKMIIGDYLKPEINPATVSQMEDSGIYPCCGYLVTHGLADSLKRLVRDTGLGAKVYANMIPFEGNSFDLGKELDIDPISAAMNGGEDYRLLFVVPILQMEKFRHDFQTFDIIGHLAQSDVGAVLVSPDGIEHPVSAPGWPTSEENF